MLACHLRGLMALQLKSLLCLDTSSLGFIGLLCSQWSELGLRISETTQRSLSVRDGAKGAGSILEISRICRLKAKWTFHKQWAYFMGFFADCSSLES